MLVVEETIEGVRVELGAIAKELAAMRADLTALRQSWEHIARLLETLLDRGLKRGIL